MADGGTMVLSGLLDFQKDDVLAAFAGCGFELTGTLAEEEWRTLLLVRSVVAGEESATAG